MRHLNRYLHINLRQYVCDLKLNRAVKTASERYVELGLRDQRCRSSGARRKEGFVSFGVTKMSPLWGYKCVRLYSSDLQRWHPHRIIEALLYRSTIFAMSRFLYGSAANAPSEQTLCNPEGDKKHPISQPHGGGTFVEK